MHLPYEIVNGLIMVMELPYAIVKVAVFCCWIFGLHCYMRRLAQVWMKGMKNLLFLLSSSAKSLSVRIISFGLDYSVDVLEEQSRKLDVRCFESNLALHSLLQLFAAFPCALINPVQLGTKLLQLYFSVLWVIQAEMLAWLFRVFVYIWVLLTFLTRIRFT